MKISKTEIKNQKLSRANLNKAVNRLTEMGIVTIESVLSKKWCEKMNKAWIGDYKLETKNRPGNHYPPNGPTWKEMLDFPYIDPLAIENPWGIEVIRDIMGEGIWGTLPYHTNTNWPGSKFKDDQLKIHRDQGQFFPELKVPQPPTWMIIHIPLIDFNDENGSTEVWPGSHHILDTNPKETRLGPFGGRMEKRASKMPSRRMNVPQGSVIIRDMRIWHRAMPNKSTKPRCMLSLVYRKGTLGLSSTNGLGPLPKFLKERLSPNAQKLYRALTYPEHIDPIIEKDEPSQDEKLRANIYAAEIHLYNLGFDRTMIKKGIQGLKAKYKKEKRNLADSSSFDITNQIFSLLQ